MVRIEIAYEGQLHTRCRHGPSGRELATDAPVDNQGRGESFSPTDLVAAALGSCMLTVMGIVAGREGWPLEGAQARVEKEMASEPRRRIGRLAVLVTMPSGLPDAARRSLEEAARTCPVAESLGDIRVDLRFEWPEGKKAR